MTFILAIFKSKLARQVGAALLFVIGIFGMGARWRGDREKAKDAKEALKTHRDIDNADTGNGDADDGRDWLRKRGGRP